MPRFYVPPEQFKQDVILLDKEESRHALSVLRLKRGDAVGLFDGRGNHSQGVVLGAKKGLLCVSRGDRKDPPISQSFPLVLGVSVLKMPRMDLLVQKACELGVSEIALLTLKRTVVRIPENAWSGKLKRWQRIAKESCKQCGRADIPVIRSLKDWKDLFRESPAYDRILIPTLGAPGQGLDQALQGAGLKRILALVGPEGDFTKEEVEFALSQGAIPVTLGALILRSETAALYLASCVRFLRQNF